MRLFAGEVLHHRQNAERRTVAQGVAGEVRRPALVGPHGTRSEKF